MYFLRCLSLALLSDNVGRVVTWCSSIENYLIAVRGLLDPEWKKWWSYNCIFRCAYLVWNHWEPITAFAQKSLKIKCWDSIKCRDLQFLRFLKLAAWPYQWSRLNLARNLESIRAKDQSLSSFSRYMDVKFYWLGQKWNRLDTNLAVFMHYLLKETIWYNARANLRSKLVCDFIPASLCEFSEGEAPNWHWKSRDRLNGIEIWSKDAWSAIPLELGDCPVV